MNISDIGSDKVPDVPHVPVDQIVPIQPSVPSASADSLGVIISNPKARRVAYACYAGLSLIVTNCAVAFSAIGLQSPDWLTVSLAVVGNLATPFAALAISNAKK